MVIGPTCESEKLEILATLIAGLQGISFNISMRLFQDGKPRVVANGISEERAVEIEHQLGVIGIACDVVEFGSIEADSSIIPPGTDLLRPPIEQSSDPGDLHES